MRFLFGFFRRIGMFFVSIFLIASLANKDSRLRRAYETEKEKLTNFKEDVKSFLEKANELICKLDEKKKELEDLVNKIPNSSNLEELSNLTKTEIGNKVNGNRPPLDFLKISDPKFTENLNLYNDCLSEGRDDCAEIVFGDKKK